ACLEPFLLTQRGLLVDQQTEPFRVLKSTAFGIGREIAEPFAMPSRPSSHRRSSVGWFSKVVLLNGNSRSRGCRVAMHAGHRLRNHCLIGIERQRPAATLTAQTALARPVALGLLRLIGLLPLRWVAGWNSPGVFGGWPS